MYKFFLLLGCLLAFHEGQGSIELVEGNKYSVPHSRVKLHLQTLKELKPGACNPYLKKKCIFYILRNSNEESERGEDFLGQVTVTWHPQQYYSHKKLSPFFFIDQIYIGTEAVRTGPFYPQKEGYGTSAMSTLFVLLKKSTLYQKGTRVSLECPAMGYLPKWYESLGFVSEGASSAETQHMSTLLSLAASKNMEKISSAEDNTKASYADAAKKRQQSVL